MPLSNPYTHPMPVYNTYAHPMPIYAAVGMYPHVKEAVENGQVLLEWDYSKGTFIPYYPLHL